MHCVKTEFVKVDGKWKATDKLVQPQGERCMVLMDKPKTHSAGGLELPEEFQEVTWEGVVVACGPKSNYPLGTRVVVGKHSGIQELHYSTKSLYVIATNDEIIHVVTEVTRDPTAAEMDKLTAEDTAKASIAAARASLVAQMNAETQQVVDALK